MKSTSMVLLHSLETRTFFREQWHSTTFKCPKPFGYNVMKDVNDKTIPKDKDSHDVFSGSAGLQDAVQHHGAEHGTFEREKNPQDDILMKDGFDRLIKSLKGIRPRNNFGVGWCHWQMDCSSWVPASMDTHQRYHQDQFDKCEGF